MLPETNSVLRNIFFFNLFLVVEVFFKISFFMNSIVFLRNKNIFEKNQLHFFPIAHFFFKLFNFCTFCLAKDIFRPASANILNSNIKFTIITFFF